MCLQPQESTDQSEQCEHTGEHGKGVIQVSVETVRRAIDNTNLNLPRLRGGAMGDGKQMSKSATSLSRKRNNAFSSVVSTMVVTNNKGLILHSWLRGKLKVFSPQKLDSMGGDRHTHLLASNRRCCVYECVPVCVCVCICVCSPAHIGVVEEAFASVCEFFVSMCEHMYDYV